MDDLQAMIQRYEQELMQLHRTAAPAPSSAPTPQDDTAHTTTLQVRVSAANEAIAIAGAVVTVSRETVNGLRVPQVRITDTSGLTEPILLPATDPALTLQPAEDIPLVTYQIDVAADGYYRAQSSGVPLYGGVPTVLPLSLIPLPEFEGSDAPPREYPIPRNNL